MKGGARAIMILIFIVVIGVGIFLAHSGFVSGLKSFTSGLTRLFPPSSSSSSSQGGVSSTQPASSQSAPPSVPWYEQSSTPPANSSAAVPWYEQTGTSSINPSDIPTGYTIDQLSPYFHRVRLRYVSAGSFYSVGQISLYANLNGSDTVDVTGWMLRANTGGEVVPQAVNLYDPSGLAAPDDIVLKSGDYVNIYTSASAIGENLRLNKCTGYLEDTNHFNPSLPQDCPSISQSDISGFSGQCQNYITSLYSCALPAPNPPVPQNDYGCINYLTTINFKGCYERHSGDSDFLSHEWRVWTSYTFLDQYHDKLQLLDKNGLLVDLYQY